MTTRERIVAHLRLRIQELNQPIIRPDDCRITIDTPQPDARYAWVGADRDGINWVMYASGFPDPDTVEDNWRENSCLYQLFDLEADALERCQIELGLFPLQATGNRLSLEDGWPFSPAERTINQRPQVIQLIEDLAQLGQIDAAAYDRIVADHEQACEALECGTESELWGSQLMDLRRAITIELEASK